MAGPFQSGHGYLPALTGAPDVAGASSCGTIPGLRLFRLEATCA